MKLKPSALFIVAFIITVLCCLAIGQVQSQPDTITPTIIHITIPEETYNNRLDYLVPQWQATLWAMGEYRVIEISFAKDDAQVIDVALPPGFYINQITWTPSPTPPTTPSPFMTNTPNVTATGTPTPNCAFEQNGARVEAWCVTPTP